jgi:hypothetical protein
MGDRGKGEREGNEKPPFRLALSRMGRPPLPYMAKGKHDTVPIGKSP